MIGQEKLLDRIDKLIHNGFPRFFMLVGSKGCGKKLMCKEISKKLGYPLVPLGVSVEEVREIITNSYRNTENIIYVLSDTDKMSVAAKNALLKITEEPPQRAYFALTVTDLSNTIDTLKSRACVLTMDSYTDEQLHNYLNLKYDNSKLEKYLIDFVVQTATVPQEVDTLMSYDVKEFYEFVKSVANNLHTVSSANAFKMEQKLALKKDEDKWDVLLFLQALKQSYIQLGAENNSQFYYSIYCLTSNLIKEIKYKNSVNKQYCMDQFILSVRRYWRELQ